MTWNDITIGQYIQIKQILDTDVPDGLKQVELLKVVTGNKDIDNLPFCDMLDEMKNLAFLTKPMEEPKLENIKTAYEIKGKKYEFYGNISKLTTGQYIDYVNYTKSVKTDLDSVAAYSKVLSVILIPEGHKYCDGYNVEELQRDIEDFVSIKDAMTIAFFLQIYFKVFVRIFLKSLMKKLKKTEIPKDLLDKLTDLQNMDF